MPAIREAILANVATKDGYVMIDGWRTQTAYLPQDIVYDLQMAGVAGIIHFDINRFEGDASTSLALTMEMDQQVVIPVYSSGTVHSLDDMARLRYLPNIHGVIIGEALLNERFSLQEALACRRAERHQPGAGDGDDGVGARHPASGEESIWRPTASLPPCVGGIRICARRSPTTIRTSRC